MKKQNEDKIVQANPCYKSYPDLLFRAILLSENTLQLLSSLRGQYYLPMLHYWDHTFYLKGQSWTIGTWSVSHTALHMFQLPSPDVTTLETLEDRYAIELVPWHLCHRLLDMAYMWYLSKHKPLLETV